jgi:superfamily II DNA or RNA helicase
MSFKELCFPKTFTHNPSQKFVAKWMSPKGKQKHALIVHKIGSGKTCVGVLASLQWVDKKDIIFIVPASLTTNVLGEYRSQCAGTKYISKSEQNQLKLLKPSDPRYKSLINTINARIEEDITIISFQTFLSDTPDLSNAFIIIDEVQNIVSERGSVYQKFKELLLDTPPQTRIMLMSATPIFDAPVELALTYNLLKPKKPLPSTSQEFNEQFIDKENMLIKNKSTLLSHLNSYISYSPGAPEIAFPKQNFRVVNCKMSPFQYAAYKTVEEQEGPLRLNNLLNLSSAFLMGQRIVSNIAYPNNKVKEDGFPSLTQRAIEQIKTYSAKIPKILKNTKHDGPAIIYSNFRNHGGLAPFIKYIESKGYIYFKHKNAHHNKYNKKRYALWSGTEHMNEKEEGKQLYNQPENKDGSIIKLMLISPSGKEGLSLFRTKSLHVFEPYWNQSRMDQIIGRGIRFCSHKDLPKAERYVNVYLYIATAPHASHTTVDQHIYDLMKKKYGLMEQFYSLIREVAVDKKLYR